MPVFEENKPLYDLTSFNILIVEDSMFMQNLVVAMLKAFGVGDIMIADSGNEAIDILKITQARAVSQYVSRVDIVVMDWLMKKGSGEDLLRWIRTHQQDSVRFMPVIVLSGYTTGNMTYLARDLGANEVLTKPISANGLASRIVSVINRPRPFINVADYFGPDRRRQEQAYNGPERRITKAEEIKVIRHDRA